MYKRYSILAILLLLLAGTLSAQSFSAQLTGAAEVPGPGDPDGTGLAVITLDGTTTRYSVLVQNIGTPTAAHIHRGAAGTSGPAVIDLNAGALASGSVSGVAQSLVAEIAGNPAGFYVNVHTAEFPAGAVRGQLAGSSSGGARNTFIPVVGKVAGQNNTNFVSDLRIVNNGAAAASVQLDYFAQSASGHTAPTATRTISILPGEQKVLDDFVGNTLAIASGLGGLRISSDQNVVAVTRVINDLRGQNLGTNGFAFNASEAAATSGIVPFLISNQDFRTNLGYFNPSSSPVTATFTARRTTDGSVLGTQTIIIPGWSMVQQGAFQLISSVPVADQIQNNYYATWTASGALFVYGSVVDNRTGDSVLVQ